MSVYRTLLAAVAAMVIATPVFADDAMPAQNPSATAQPTMPADQATAPAVTKVNLNSASVKDLMKVKGLNATRAKAIIAYRKKHGDFKSLDQLASVKGFKKVTPNKMKSIQDQLTIE